MCFSNKTQVLWFFIIIIEVQLIYNVLISAVQQSDSAAHIVFI